MTSWHTAYLAILAAACLLLAGCGGHDYTYENAADRKPGPGLFSGPDGVFTLIPADQDTPTREKDDPASPAAPPSHLDH